MSYFKEGISGLDKNFIYIIDKVAEETNIYPQLDKLEPYMHMQKNGFKLKLPKDENGNTYIPDDLRDSFIRFLRSVTIFLLELFAIVIFKMALRKFYVGRIQKTARNTKFIKYLDENKYKIEKDNPDLHPCSKEEFLKAPFFEKLASEFREKSTKEAAKALARLTITRVSDVYGFFKMPGAKALMTILFILRKNKNLDDKNLLGITALYNFKMLSVISLIKVVLGMYGINLGIISLYSRLMVYKNQAIMIRINMTPKGLRLQNLELYYYYIKANSPDKKVFIKKPIPDPPESVYQVSQAEINKEIKKLSKMSDKQLDRYAKGLLENDE